MPWPLLAFCWDSRSELTRELCCHGPRSAEVYRRCFDLVYTPEECCPPEQQGGGFARRSPASVPEPLRAPQASQRLSHPSFGRAQRTFERRHADCTKVIPYVWTSGNGNQVTLKLRVFKRSLMVATADFGNTLNFYLRTFGNYLSQTRESEPPVFIDVGASVGIFAVGLALEFPSARVFAVEPAPQNYRYLLWNIRAHNLTGRIWPVNAAIRGPGGPDALSLQYSPIWPISTGYCPSSEEGDCEFQPYTVPALDWTSLVNLLDLRRLTWLKVDCEGCEWQLASDPAFLLMLLTAVNLATVEFHTSEAASHDAAVATVRAVCLPGPWREELLRRLANGDRWARACSRRLGPAAGYFEPV
mmetsp:Transcript_34221/g.98528  ORF Transcript_34221/g.98528 Transcript_34221/m.98528 type:complete len:358 (+) Transcript_34221:49-1122(+)